MFLSPATSIKKYNINGKKIIIVGEIHSLIQPNDNKVKTWDFLNKKLKEGDIIHMEVHPEFKKNPKQYLDIRNAINIQKFFKGKKEYKNIEGIDYRRLKDFFGMFENMKLQRSFFYMRFADLAKTPIWALLRVVDNIMIFINKHFYGKMRNDIIKLNKQYLDELYHLHVRIDNHTKYLKSKAKKTDTFKDVVAYYKKPIEYKNILEEYRAFVVKFMDLLVIMNIIMNPNENHTMLIGEFHAKNIYNMLKKYNISYK